MKLFANNSKVQEFFEDYAKIAKKHGVCVLVKSLINLDEKGVEDIMESMLMAFPVRSLFVDIPEWMRLEDADNRLIAPLLQCVRDNLHKIKNSRTTMSQRLSPP